MENINQNYVNKECKMRLDSLYQDSSKALANFKNDVNKWLELYNCTYRNKDYKGKSNVFVPEFFKALETLAGNIYELTFQDDPFYTILGRTQADEDKAKDASAMLEYALNEMEFKRRYLDVVRSLLRNGIVVVNLCWKYEEKETIRKEIDPLSGVAVPYRTNEPYYDAPEMNLINIIDFFFDPQVNNLQESEWVMHREKVSASKLKSLEDEGVLSGVYAMLGEKKSSNKESNEDNLKKQQLFSSGLEPLKEKPNEYTIFKYWGLLPKWWIELYNNPEMAEQPEFDFEGFKEANSEEVEARLVYCDDHDVILKLSENPYWHKQKPFIMCNLIPVEGNATGIGLGRIAEKQQIEVNDKRNLIIDGTTLAVFNMWLKYTGSNIKRKDLKIEPNKVIDTDVEGGGLTPLRPDSTSINMAINSENIGRDDIRESLGANATLQGSQLRNQRSATEVSMIAGNSTGRVKLYTVQIAEQFLKPFLKMTLQLIQQYMDDTKVLRIIDQQNVSFREITPMQIQGDYDLIPKLMTDATNKQTIRRDMTEMLGILAKLGNVIPPEQLYAYVRKLYEFMGFKDVNEILPPAEELKKKQMIEQIEALKAQQGQMPQEVMTEQMPVEETNV